MDNPSLTNDPENGNQQPARSGNQGSRIGEVQQQVDDVKIVSLNLKLFFIQYLLFYVISQNVTSVLERGERLDNLDDRTAALQETVN